MKSEKPLGPGTDRLPREDDPRALAPRRIAGRPALPLAADDEGPTDIRFGSPTRPSTPCRRGAESSHPSCGARAAAVESQPSCPRTSTSAPPFLEQAAQRLAFRIRDGRGLEQVRGEPAVPRPENPGPNQPPLAFAARLRSESGDQTGNRSPSLRDQDLLAVFDPQEIFGKRGLQLRDGSFFHWTSIA